MPRKPKSIAELTPTQRQKYIQDRAKTLIKEGWSDEDLREFRRQIAKLKRKGIVPTTVSSRRALPTRNLKKLVANFNDVVQGTARVFKVPLEVARNWKDAPQALVRVVRDKLIVPKTHYVTRTGKKRKTKKGKARKEAPPNVVVKNVAQRGRNYRITAQALPIPVTSYEGFREAVLATYGDKKLPPGKVWAFRFYGWNSYRTFGSLDDLFEFWERYETTEGATPKQEINERKRWRDHEQDNISNLEIVTIERGARWGEENSLRKRREAKARRKTFRELNPLQVERIRERDRLRKRASYDTAANTRRKRKQRKRKGSSNGKKKR